MNSTIAFGGNTYSNKSLFDLRGPELVELHNKLAAKAKVPETKRFSSIGAGVERTWKLLQQVGAQAAPEAKAPKAEKAKPAPGNLAGSLGTVAPKKSAAKKSAEGKAPARRGTNLAAPGFAPIPCREGSKQAVLLDKLCSSNGATMAELLDATKFGNKPWTEASVRAGFGWDMKQKGYGVRSEFDDKGVERFFIVLPVGHQVAKHTPLKGVPKADARQTKLPA